MLYCSFIFFLKWNTLKDGEPDWSYCNRKLLASVDLLKPRGVKQKHIGGEGSWAVVRQRKKKSIILPTAQ